ncbi:hypothetical protein PMZ80_004373 [Knufia obscura]|uniref:Uncharacterized protein n=1 Tax=Knufia obscura TaxID=1635080 RepID=A0ABR0RRX0_9EURO|nr:hypothetical protein PMZ80_004373 [Knufia obscura]
MPPHFTTTSPSEISTKRKRPDASSTEESNSELQMDHDLDNGRASKHTKTTIDATTRAELKVELKVEPISELKQELKEELKAEVKAELKEELIAELMAAKMQITTSKDKINEVRQLYSSTIVAIERRIDQLNDQVMDMIGSTPNSSGITTADYAAALRRHIPAAKAVTQRDTKIGFDLLMYMADASHADMDASQTMCGTEYDESSEVFEDLDELLVRQIEKMQAEPPLAAIEADVQPGSLPGERKAAYLGAGGCQGRRIQREQIPNSLWAPLALRDLSDQRDYLDEYGVGSYFPKCIARLKEICNDGVVRPSRPLAISSDSSN